jgi:N-acetylmuramoyl-L-alanine amidase
VKAPTTTLKPGDTGPQVKRLQKALVFLKYSPGKPDGDYGPGTKQAVTNFQTAQGLTADGVVGPQTLAALKKALAKAGG